MTGRAVVSIGQTARRSNRVAPLAGSMPIETMMILHMANVEVIFLTPPMQPESLKTMTNLRMLPLSRVNLAVLLAEKGLASGFGKRRLPARTKL